MKTPQDRVESGMSQYPSIVSCKTTVTEALEFMKQLEVRHLPVVEGAKVLGVVSERDLRQVELLSDSMQMLVGDVMTPDPYCVPTGTPLSEVTQVMCLKKYGSALIVNELGSVVGIFTSTDALRLLSEILTSDSAPPAAAQGIELLLEAGRRIGKY